MKKSYIALITIAMLFFPIIAISFAWIIFNYFIFDNPEFWYGYMAYFGTIVLAAVALWQNHFFKVENDRSQNRLEKLNKQANEISIISKLSEFENDRIHRLFNSLDEFEKICHPNNISIGIFESVDDRVTIMQMSEKCDFYYLAVIRELRIDMRNCTAKNELKDLCYKLYNSAIGVMNEYDYKKSIDDTSLSNLRKVWKEYFLTKEKYLKAIQKDFQKLLYGDLSLEEIRNIYYKDTMEDENDGQQQ